MKYCKNYCEEEEISTSKLNEAQRTLYYIAENMKMDKSISEEGYKHFQIAIKALKQEPKIGYWIIIDDCEKFIAKCSECGQIEDSRMIGKYAYCHCGARMVEPQEGSKE